MSTTGWSAVRVWDNSEGADIPGASSAQATSIDKKLVPKFATKTARNGAADATAANNAGRVCYVEELAGFTFHDGVAWRALGPRSLYSFSGAGTVFANSATPTNAIDTGGIALPAGSRLLMLVSHGYMTTDGGTGQWVSGRAFLQQSGAPIGVMFQTRLDGDNTNPGAFSKQSFTLVDTVVASGTVSFQLSILKEGGTATWAYLISGALRVIDLGPASAV